jgi:hypothetical protein
MNTATRPSNTQSQLRNLMAQHTATTYAKPVVASPTPVAVVTKALPQAVGLPTKAALVGVRYTVRLSPSEITRLDAISLETHQRLGKRLTVSEVFRIGLARVGSNAPITAEELQGIRSLDRRRTGGVR